MGLLDRLRGRARQTPHEGQGVPVLAGRPIDASGPAGTAAPDRAERVISSSPAPVAPGGEPPADRPIYALDYPHSFWTPQSPKRKPDSYVSLEDLRRLADVYDVLRACIQHLKREVTSVPLEIVARDDKADGKERRIQAANGWFERRGGIGGVGRRRSQFEGVLIEDLCVVGAACVYYRPARAGRPYEVLPIDAATIRPRVDPWGWPGPTEIVYEQWIYGTLVGGYTREEMQYDGVWPTSYSPYFKSPVEWLVLVATTALKADEWDRLWLTEGNMPSDLIAVPENWKPADIKAYAQMWRDLLSGDIRERQMVKFVPAGTNKLMNPTRKDQEFSELALWLLRRTCSIMGVQPASIGYVGEQYKVSQEESMAQTTEFGAQVLLTWFKDFYDDVLARLGFEDLEIRHVTEQGERVEARTERLVKACGGPFLTINEARAEDGKEGVAGGDVIILPATLVPLPDLVEQAALTTAQSEQALEQGEMGMTPGYPPEGGEPGGNGASPPPAPPAGGGDVARAYEEAREELETFLNPSTALVPVPESDLTALLRAAPGPGESEGHWVTVHGKPIFIEGKGAAGHPKRQQVQGAVAAKHAATAKAVEKTGAATAKHAKAFEALQKKHAPQAAKLEGLGKAAQAAVAQGEAKAGDSKTTAKELSQAIDLLHAQAEAAHASGNTALAEALLKGAQALSMRQHYHAVAAATGEAAAKKEKAAKAFLQSWEPKPETLATIKENAVNAALDHPKPGPHNLALAKELKDAGQQNVQEVHDQLLAMHQEEDQDPASLNKVGLDYQSHLQAAYHANQYHQALAARLQLQAQIAPTPEAVTAAAATHSASSMTADIHAMVAQEHSNNAAKWLKGAVKAYLAGDVKGAQDQLQDAQIATTAAAAHQQAAAQKEAAAGTLPPTSPNDPFADQPHPMEAHYTPSAEELEQNAADAIQAFDQDMQEGNPLSPEEATTKHDTLQTQIQVHQSLAEKYHDQGHTALAQHHATQAKQKALEAHGHKAYAQAAQTSLDAASVPTETTTEAPETAPAALTPPPGHPLAHMMGLSPETLAKAESDAATLHGIHAGKNAVKSPEELQQILAGHANSHAYYSKKAEEEHAAGNHEGAIEAALDAKLAANQHAKWSHYGTLAHDSAAAPLAAPETAPTAPGSPIFGQDPHPHLPGIDPKHHNPNYTPEMAAQWAATQDPYYSVEELQGFQAKNLQDLKQDVAKHAANPTDHTWHQVEQSQKYVLNGAALLAKMGGTLPGAHETAPPAPPAPPTTLAMSDLTKTGEKPGGSLPGAMFTDAEGKQHLVKFVKSAAHAKNEVLAGALYQLMGAAVPNLALVKDGDKTHVASQWLPGAQGLQSKLQTGSHPEAHQDFVTHAWLANWDAVGLDYDNQVLHNGKTHTIDVGGALEYRAQGAPKGDKFSNHVTELSTLRDPSKNLQAANAFKNITDAEIAQGAAKLAAIPDAQIRAVVQAHGGDDALADKLIARKQSILGQVDISGVQAAGATGPTAAGATGPTAAAGAASQLTTPVAGHDPNFHLAAVPAAYHEHAGLGYAVHGDAAEKAKSLVADGTLTPEDAAGNLTHYKNQALKFAQQSADAHAAGDTTQAASKAAQAGEQAGKALIQAHILKNAQPTDAPSPTGAAGAFTGNEHLAHLPEELHEHASVSPGEHPTANKAGKLLAQHHSPQSLKMNKEGLQDAAVQMATLAAQHHADGKTTLAQSYAQDAGKAAKASLKWHYAEQHQAGTASPTGGTAPELPTNAPAAGASGPTNAPAAAPAAPTAPAPTAPPADFNFHAAALHPDLHSGGLLTPEEVAEHQAAGQGKAKAHTVESASAKIAYHQEKALKDAKTASNHHKKGNADKAAHYLKYAKWHAGKHAEFHGIHQSLGGTPEAAAPAAAKPSPTPTHAVLQQSGPKGVPHIKHTALFEHQEAGVTNLYSPAASLHDYGVTYTKHKNYVQKTYGDVLASYTVGEKTGITQYTGSSFGLNMALRQAKGEVPPHYAEWVGRLDSAMAKSPIKEPLVIWRGEGLSSGVDPTTWPEKDIGHGKGQFPHHEYGSWSTHPFKPVEFAQQGSVKILRRITLQPGHKAIPTVKSHHDGNGYNDEREFILARGTTVRTTHVETATIQGQLVHIVHQEIVHQK